jgi:dihydrofolate reductase
MAIIRVVNFMSLDGVVQSVLSADEDTEGGFTAGGWVSDHMDETVAKIMSEATVSASAMLLGRRTYDSFAAIWPSADPSEAPVAAMNRMPKYLVSRTRSSASWHNTTVINNVADVSGIKSRTVGDIVVFGSATLLQELFRQRLVDEVWLLVFPLVIGSGKKMFPDGSPAIELWLTSSQSTPSGVVVHRYTVLGD